VLAEAATFTTTSPGFTLTSKESGALVANFCCCAVALEIVTESHFTSKPLSVACTLTFVGSFGQATVVLDATDESNSEQPDGMALAIVIDTGRKENNAATSKAPHIKMCARVPILRLDFRANITYKL
jgi:hypothetical protein